MCLDFEGVATLDPSRLTPNQDLRPQEKSHWRPNWFVGRSVWQNSTASYELVIHMNACEKKQKRMKVLWWGVGPQGHDRLATALKTVSCPQLAQKTRRVHRKATSGRESGVHFGCLTWPKSDFKGRATLVIFQVMIIPGCYLEGEVKQQEPVGETCRAL